VIETAAAMLERAISLMPQAYRNRTRLEMTFTTTDSAVGEFMPDGTSARIVYVNIKNLGTSSVSVYGRLILDGDQVGEDAQRINVRPTDPFVRLPLLIPVDVYEQVERGDRVLTAEVFFALFHLRRRPISPGKPITV
jgi:hypothetical protein